MAGELIRPLARDGIAQIAAVAPQSVNAYLDQLGAVGHGPADLGYYAIAVSITLLPGPLVSAPRHVLLPSAGGGGEAAPPRPARSSGRRCWSAPAWRQPSCSRWRWRRLA